VNIWKNRCYFEGIPDSISAELSRSKRIPNYKAIALAILRNDHNLYSLGFSERHSDIVEMLTKRTADSKQLVLFK
jgi:predicted phosphoadenosine phosphosulfate sulfurtransferase